MWDPTHLCLQMEWHDMSSILLCSKYITNAKYSISHEMQLPLKNQDEHLYKTPKVEQYDLGDVQGSLQVIVHKEVASLWSEARTGATAALEKSAIQSFEFWTELCIALLRRGGGGVTWKGPIESRASRGSGSWQPCALYSSHRHIAIPVMRWMTTQPKVGISQLSKLLGPAIVKIVPAIAKSWWWYAWHWQEARYNSKLTFRRPC